MLISCSNNRVGNYILLYCLQWFYFVLFSVQTLNVGRNANYNSSERCCFKRLPLILRLPFNATCNFNRFFNPCKSSRLGHQDLSRMVFGWFVHSLVCPILCHLQWCSWTAGSKPCPDNCALNQVDPPGKSTRGWLSWKKQSMPEGNSFPGTETGRRKRDSKQTGSWRLVAEKKPKASSPDMVERKTHPQDMQAAGWSLLQVGSPKELRAVLERNNSSDNELIYKSLFLL